MNDNRLTGLIETWKPHIIVKGSEFLLPLQMAISFAEDLVMVEEIIIGYDGWRYVDKARNWIVQATEVELTLEEHISWENMTPEKNFEILQTFLKCVPENIDFISFQMNNPEVAHKIMQEASSC